MSTGALYEEDLAWIHHTGFGDFARQTGPQVLRLLRAAGIPGGTLVDLACGSGIWAALAHRHGFKVIGVDQSAAMLRLAKREAPQVQFYLESLYRFAFPPCDAVTIIGEGLNYLSPGERPAARLQQFFAQVARALKPGGLLIFDVMIREGKPFSYARWREGHDWVILFAVEENARRTVLTRRHIAFRKKGNSWRRVEERHHVQLFTRAEIERALRHNGFSVRVTRRYGTFRLFPHRLAFIARRRRTP